VGPLKPTRAAENLFQRADEVTKVSSSTFPYYIRVLACIPLPVPAPCTAFGVHTTVKDVTAAPTVSVNTPVGNTRAPEPSTTDSASESRAAVTGTEAPTATLGTRVKKAVLRLGGDRYAHWGSGLVRVTNPMTTSSLATGPVLLREREAQCSPEASTVTWQVASGSAVTVAPKAHRRTTRAGIHAAHYAHQSTPTHSTHRYTCGIHSARYYTRETTPHTPRRYYRGRLGQCKVGSKGRVPHTRDKRGVAPSPEEGHIKEMFVRVMFVMAMFAHDTLRSLYTMVV
jgi:hypothetical protein